MLADLRLLQLLSPVLPVGAYNYSQGFEWVVNAGWVKTCADLDQWLGELIDGPLVQQDLPLLRKLYDACLDNDVVQYDYWSHMAVALRDTTELRAEERARAGAYARLITQLLGGIDERFQDGLQRTPFASIALASVRWQISVTSLLQAYAFNWLDAYIVNGVKIIPLGQTEGQALLHRMLPALSAAVEHSLIIDNDNIGISTPCVSSASCAHELQYSRLYRS